MQKQGVIMLVSSKPGLLTKIHNFPNYYFKPNIDYVVQIKSNLFIQRSNCFYYYLLIGTICFAFTIYF